MNITQIENTVTLSSTQVSGFSYVHVIQQVTISSTTTIHSVITSSNSSKTLPGDGYYLLTEIKLPTTPGDYYYIMDDTIYSPSDEVITIAQLMLLDPTLNNLDRNDNELFTTFNVNEYYIKALKARFQNIICGCTNCDPSSELIMDTVDMGISLIKYLNIYSQYYESQRIIEQLSNCLGLSISTCNCNA